MHCCDTGEIPAVRLENLDVKTISKLNRIIGAIKRLIQGNARVTLIVNGGRIERYEVSKIVQVDDPA